MKREGHLLEKIVNPENIRIAFFKAAKGKDDKREVREFRNQLEKRILEIREKLILGQYHFGQYRFFTIYDPKKRLICAAAFGERVVFHAMMNICHANFERYQIYDSYASRVGKGVSKALERAQFFCRKYMWYLKMDIRKYFDSISHEVLKKLLLKRFKDKKLINLFDRLIESYASEEGKGIPIGNLTSQYFANHYLAVADHYAKEVLGVKAYIRYMDDIIMHGNNKHVLLKMGRRFESFCQKTLCLDFKIFALNACCYGLPFLGYIVYGRYLRLSLRSKRRFKNKAILYNEAYENFFWTEGKCREKINALLAFVRKADSYGYRKSVLYKGVFKGF